MKSSIEQVREFHEAFGVPDSDTPNVSNLQINELRVKLLGEESNELGAGLSVQDPVAVLDALIDIQYVLDGAFLQLGFANVKDAAFAEVHRSNMSKLGADGKPIRREDGKVLKGPSYSPPNLAQFIQP